MTHSKHPAGHILQAFHDGELSPAETTSTVSHCNQCPSCQKVLADLDQLGQLLSSVPEPELPRSVWHHVNPKQKRESRLKPVFAFTACAAGIALGILLGPIQTTSENTTTDLAWSETVSVWNDNATSSLLSVYQTDQN